MSQNGFIKEDGLKSNSLISCSKRKSIIKISMLLNKLSRFRGLCSTLFIKFIAYQAWSSFVLASVLKFNFNLWTLFHMDYRNLEVLMVWYNRIYWLQWVTHACHFICSETFIVVHSKTDNLLLIADFRLYLLLIWQSIDLGWCKLCC